MRILFNVFVVLTLIFLVSRMNELHEKVDRAGVALEHATQELDEASQFVYQQINAKKAADQKIDEELKNVPPVVAAEPAQEPEPVAPTFNAVSPEPKTPSRRRQFEKRFFIK